jgi:trigger factor
VNATVEDLGPCKKLLRVEVELPKVEETFEEVTRDFQRHARLPGFRPGKAPKDMVAKRFDSEIQAEVRKKLISGAYHQAVADQKLNVVGRPDVEEIQFARGQALQFAATLETAPDLSLPEYKGLPVRRETAGVAPADIDRALEALRLRKVTFETVSRELKQGDVAVVDYTGTCEGKPITDIAPTAKGLTEKKGFWVAVEPGSFIPGFAEQLEGMKAGDQRTVTVNFPAEFVTPQLAGKQGVYQVHLAEVKERVLPALDDAFAKSYEAASLEGLRERIRADLQNEMNVKQAQSLREQVVQTLLEKIQCDLPESVVEQETRNIVYGIVNDNQQRGLSKEALDAQKDRIYAKANAAAKERVRAGFVFKKIADKEGVRVAEGEIVARIGEMATQHKMPAEKLAAALEKNGRLEDVYFQLLNEKVIDLLVQNARIEDVPAAAP